MACIHSYPFSVVASFASLASGCTRHVPLFIDLLSKCFKFSSSVCLSDMKQNQIADEISLKTFYPKLSSDILKKSRMISNLLICHSRWEVKQELLLVDYSSYL